MKEEYDFGGGQRGVFYREKVTLIPPVHLDADVLGYLTQRAQAQGASLNDLVNTLLRKDIELIETGR